MSDVNTFHVYGGQLIDIANPTDEMIDIETIAHALSQMCRFGGHTNQFYSVAQHSVCVSLLCDPENALKGLLHDAPEAYIGDVIRPMQLHINPRFAVLDAAWQEAIRRKFELPGSLMTDDVKHADNGMLRYEAERLLSPPAVGDPWWEHLPELKVDKPWMNRFTFWSPTEAKYQFLKRFATLTAGPLTT